MKNYLIGLMIVFIFFLISLFTLSDYGLNEDSPFHFLRGQAFLQVLTSGKILFDQPKFPSPVLFIPGQKISSYKLNASESNLSPVRSIVDLQGGPTIQKYFEIYQQKAGRQSFYKHNAFDINYFNAPPYGHPPISDILMAVTNRIFYEKLGLLPDIESYHLYVVLTAVLALIVVYFFTIRTFGLEAALFSTVTLGLFPIFFAESHFNIKDIPELAFFSLSLIAFFFWVSGRKKTWFIAFTLAFFLALGTKLNILFLPFILVPWLFFIRKTEQFKLWFSKKLIIYFFIFIIINLLLFFLLWPNVLENIFQRLFGTLNFYNWVANFDSRVQKPSSYLLPFGIDLQPALMIILGAPLVTLVFFLIGLGQICKSKVSLSNLRPKAFILLWFLVPVLRSIRPGADFLGSIRQFIEFLPAMAIIAGIGAAALCKKKAFLKLIIFISYTFYLFWIIVKFHPNQNVFFNSLVGGPRGTLQKKLLNWQTSYDNPYRQAVKWLNKHVEKGARLAFLDGTMEAISLLWLRPDIYFGSYFSGLKANGEYVISIVYPEPPSVFQHLYLERFLQPIYEVKVDGVTLAKIWKNDPRFIREKYKKTVVLNEGWKKKDDLDKKLGYFWELELPKESEVISVTVKIPKQNCNRRDGLFQLNDYTVPQRLDKNDELTEFYFPAEKTDKIRFWGIIPNSCFVKGEIVGVTILER